jgi:hypothetical protein
MSKPKKPKGDCFQVHADHLLNMDEKYVADMRVCHGLVFHPTHGHHPHAWIELKELCIDLSNGRSIGVLKERYYAVGRIKKVRRYTQEQLRNKVLEHETYGPWHLPMNEAK